MIWRFQPFNISKEIGIDYNLHCSVVPNNEDWIQITDYDTLILLPECYQLIDKAIERYPDTAIFGAVTNRLGRRDQRIDQDKPDPSTDLAKHFTICREMLKKYSDGECFETKKLIAGFFLLFRKSYWKRVGGFQDKVCNERGLLFDYVFSKRAREQGLSMRIIKGLYVWHTYRVYKENWRDYSHLK